LDPLVEQFSVSAVVMHLRKWSALLLLLLLLLVLLVLLMLLLLLLNWTLARQI
jgi:hypothetical protein